MADLVLLGVDVDAFLDAAEYFEDVGLAEGDQELEEWRALKHESKLSRQLPASLRSQQQMGDSAVDLHLLQALQSEKQDAQQTQPEVEPDTTLCMAPAAAPVDGIKVPPISTPSPNESAAAIQEQQALLTTSAIPAVSVPTTPQTPAQKAALTAAFPAASPITAVPAIEESTTTGVKTVAQPRVTLWDKISFVLGCTGLWVCSYWLGRSPSTFYQLYTALGVILYSVRYLSYRARKWHYMTLDLCYACNALLFAHLWIAPRNKLLAMTTFAFNTGPLTTSILAFRNSFVIHDMEKVTSLFLHLMPACVSWAQKWSCSPKFGDVYSGLGGLKPLVAVPLAFYSVWATVYYLTVFVIAADRIKRRGYVTLFKYVTTRKRGAFAAIARRVPRPAQPLAYIALHMCFCAASLLLAAASWRSYWVHTVLIIGAGTLSFWHGAISYFLPRHHAIAAQATSASAVLRKQGSTVPSTPSSNGQTHNKQE